jgi:hypothetical protein
MGCQPSKLNEQVAHCANRPPEESKGIEPLNYLTLSYLFLLLVALTTCFITMGIIYDLAITVRNDR